MIPIVIDFETYYAKYYTLSKMPTQNYIFDPRFEVIGVAVKVGFDGETEHFTGTMLETKEYLEQFNFKDSMLIAHNALFDGAILAYKFGIIPKFYFCTMMASRPFLAPFIPRSRTSLAKVSEYLGLGHKGTEVVRAMGKRRVEFQPWEMVEYMLYCENDVNLCAKIAAHLLPMMPKDEIKLLDLNIRKYTEPKIELDRDVMEIALAKHKLMKEAVLAKAGLSDRSLLMSNDKFAAALKLMGVSPPTKTSARTGKIAYAFAKTDPGLKELLTHDNPEVQALVSARMAHKSTIEETRLTRFIALADTNHPLGVPLLYYGAHTGRKSGWDKLNMQNLKKGSALRQAIKAPYKDMIVVGDLSQIECRMAATLAGQWDMVQAFAEGRDLYCEFGSDLFGRDITPDDYVERFLSKTTVLGCQYGVGGEKYHATVSANPDVDITVNEAFRIVEKYRQTYSRIPELWKLAKGWLEHMASGAGGTQDYIIEYGPLKIHTSYLGHGAAIELPNGMAIYYPELSKDAKGQYTYLSRTGYKNIWGGAVVENVCQALANIVLNYAELFLAERGYKASLSVHDELIYIVRADIAKKFAGVLEKVLCRPVPWMPKLPVAAEVGIGPNYKDAK